MSRALIRRLFVAVALGAQAPDRSKPPALGSAAGSCCRRFRSASSRTACRLDRRGHEVPVVQVNLVVRPAAATSRWASSASPTDGRNARGRRRTRLSLDIADAIDFLGADLTAGAGATPRRAAARAGGASRRRTADHGRRRPSADLSAGGTRVGSPAAADQDHAGARQRRYVAQLGFARVIFGTAHRFGTPTGTAETMRACTVAELTPSTTSLPALQRHHVVVGDVRAAGRPAARGEVRKVGAKGAAAARVAARLARELQAAGLHHRQTWRGAVPDSDRRGGCRAIDARLLPHQVMNTVLGGAFASQAQPEPAREERLHVRGALAVRHARGGGAVRRGRWHSNRQDVLR